MAGLYQGETTLLHFPTVNLKRVQGNFYLNQVITGHGSLADYQGKFFGKSSTCDCGQETENRFHLVYKCIQWTAITKKHFPRDFAMTPLDKLLHHKE
ncbi:hypothetical protein CEXT_700561 [Caerostris extrusa]|uniref:Reverse transcriptase n=1 Tax=Caerostris extrusa TaxID=172846 RepID=A0AAV4UIS4_CAEEX|nr:hypothetical protein CEXT_700561 [Caerostris extrusa]